MARPKKIKEIDNTISIINSIDNTISNINSIENVQISNKLNIINNSKYDFVNDIILRDKLNEYDTVYGEYTTILALQRILRIVNTYKLDERTMRTVNNYKGLTPRLVEEIQRIGKKL